MAGWCIAGWVSTAQVCLHTKKIFGTTGATWSNKARREHFTDAEIAEPGYTIAAIRGWNSINLSLRNQIPEQPAPGM
jgi:alkylhydroperoxidase family enzyme